MCDSCQAYGLFKGAAPIGICYGRVANNLPQPSSVVNLIKSNGIKYVRLFDIDPTTLKSFSGTRINLTIGVPNELLPFLANAKEATTLSWLQSNVFAHIPANQVRYIAVGNEVFLKDPFYTPHVITAILNLYQALKTLNLTNSIKLSSPQAASVVTNSYPPSAATFDPYIESAIIPLVQYLYDSRSPFMVNVYPYFSYINNKNHVSLDYALFKSKNNTVRDGALTYSNLFDASVDAFVSAMEKVGFEGVPVVVTETGWPTKAGEAASDENASVYNGNVVRRAADDVGTPRRPETGVEAYLFDLFDENKKGGEEYEKHFGIFGLDGVKAYDIDFN
ncbi:glucan endo-1,3-beta-glucosidase-like [Quercus robur]|uniref:glucan endo-1,3-beta-glucosidase-like n=1 Tax=Quercus robur TaxID=38942 RepID=UPI0021622A20|nr:glucan endo-1,3-beta-glucosidase-like [Quercus robur]